MKSESNFLSKEELVPYNLTIEKVILADILLNKTNLSLIFYKVQAEFFYLQNHQYIFEASKQVYDDQIEVNIDTVSDRLKTLELLEKIGGTEELISLINIAIVKKDIETYIVLLIDKHIRRQIIYGAKKIQKLAYQSFDSIENLFDEAEKVLFSITQEKPDNNLFLASEVILETFVDLEKRSLENKYLGIKSGFFDLDEITQGFQKSDLIIIAGRPSMGKTAFALNLIRNVCEIQKAPVIIFSLEMSRQQLIYRFLSKESQVMHSKLRTGNINEKEWYAVNKAINLLACLKIYLDDTPNLSLVSIRNKINSLKIQHGSIGMIVVDYLQLLNDQKNKDTRVQELSRLTRGLKILAKEFDTPLIVLSQLSRSVESRVNKRPLLSDLRESGCIAEDMQIYVPHINKYSRIGTLIQNHCSSFVISGVKNKKQVFLSSNKAKTKRAYYTGIKFVYELKLLNSKNIKITAEHKILSLKGWISVTVMKKRDLISILDIRNFSKILCLSNSFNLEKRVFYPSLSFVCLIDLKIFGNCHCYDLWIPENNNYTVNNTIVHNSIEQDADLVLMLYRDSYYDNNVSSENNDITEIIITKHRNGPIGTINLLFEPKTLTFENFIF